MRLIHKATGIEAKVGDTVKNRDGEDLVIRYFRPPHKAASQGHVTVSPDPIEDGPLHTFGSEFYVSVVGLEWIEREDRGEPYSIKRPIKKGRATPLEKALDLALVLTPNAHDRMFMRKIVDNEEWDDTRKILEIMDNLQLGLACNIWPVTGEGAGASDEE